MKKRGSCSKPINIDDLLAQLQEAHIILRADGDRVALWCPGYEIPPDLQRRVARHKREILRLLALSDPRVCPSRELHMCAEVVRVRMPRCPFCDQLRPFIDVKQNREKTATARTARRSTKAG